MAELEHLDIAVLKIDDAIAEKTQMVPVPHTAIDHHETHSEGFHYPIGFPASKKQAR